MTSTNRPALETKAGTAYEIHGAGPPIVLIHGVGLNRHVWTPQITALAARFQVIAYDTLGHGDSPMPPDGVDLDAYLGQLLELLDTLGLERVSLIGHSMGGLIAQSFALAQPQRVAAIAALTAVYDRTAEHRARALATAERLQEGGPTAVLETTLARWFSDEDRSSPVRAAKISQLRAWLLAADRDGYARAYRMFAENGDHCVGRLPELRQPALFMTAEGDPNSTPAMSEAMAAAAPQGEALVIAGERHMLPFVAPEKVNPVLDAFLSRVYGSPADGPGETARAGEMEE